MDGLKIASVTIENGNIFNPELKNQDSWVHSIANQLHIKTRKQTIEDQLLFAPEQPYSDRLVKETERKIRAQNYIHDVKIEPQQVCDDRVSLRVVSTDNWTLTPSVSVGHSGGVTRTSYELKEANLLGLGTRIMLKSDSNEDRDQNTFALEDNNWFGGHKKLDLSLSDNSDGYNYSVGLSRPFYQLDSTSAWSMRLGAAQLEHATYNEGVIENKVGEENRFARFAYGWSQGLIEDAVTRFQLGWHMSESDYFVTSDYPLSPLPSARTTRYPFLAYEYLQDDFIAKTNFQVMGVSEDIALGDHLTLSAGWKDEAFGSSQNGHVLGLDYSFGSLLGDQTLGFFELQLGHESNSIDADKGRLKLGGRIYYYQDDDHSYLFSSSFEAAQNPEDYEQFVLGGDSGLKGYPIRYQNGDRKLTMSLEKRVYFNWYPLQMLKLGAAIFADAGAAWNAGEDPTFISDVGFGLRLVSTRQSDSKVLHADIAFPISDRDQVDSYQIFIKAESQF